jgi:hypothetical protein
MRKFHLMVLCVTLALAAGAGPVEFGRREVDRALVERKLAPEKFRLQTDVSTDRPESFRIVSGRVSGGDLRGLMYGLLEAAQQIRERGRLVAVKASPATAIRGVRLVVRPEDTQKEWFRSRDSWHRLFELLASSRFNRLSLAFVGQAGAPSDVESLGHISQVAAEYAVELNLTIRAEDLAKPDGLSRAEAGPSSLLALKNLFTTCSSVRSIQIWTGPDDDDARTAFCRDWLFRAVREAGRRVTLELRESDLTPGLLKAAEVADLPLRIGRRPAAGRPTAPPAKGAFETLWQMEDPAAAGPKLWLDPAFVRRTVPVFTRAGSAGFEIEAPSPAGADGDRLFYMLWGRLSYDPKTPDSVWSRELKAR